MRCEDGLADAVRLPGVGVDHPGSIAAAGHGGGLRILRVRRDQTGFHFDAGAEPVLEVDTGVPFVVETEDAHGGTITGPNVVYPTFEAVVAALGGVNPVTGPIAVRGVRAGDLVAIEIRHVEGAPVTGWGYMRTTRSLRPEFTAETVVCRRVGGQVEVPTARGVIRIPYRPMIGTLAVAPATGRVDSYRHRADILGNVDVSDVAGGATVVLRANIDGAGIFMGDAHLAQGDAEINRSAIEAQADVEVSVRRLDPDPTVFVALPQVNTADEIASLAAGPGHLETLVRAAYDDLAARLHRGYGFTLPEAFRLLGAVGTVRVGQVIPPVATALAKIARRYVAAAG